MATATTTKQGDSSAAIDARNIRATLESVAGHLDDLGYMLTLMTSVATIAAPPPPQVPFSVPREISNERLAASITARAAELAGICRALYPQVWSCVLGGRSALSSSVTP
jgi:hypothetical protein